MLVVGDRLKIFCSNCGMIRKNYNSIIISGMDWKRFMYVCLNYCSGLMLERCIIVSSVF